MFRSLRFRLPALFLAGVALAGLVSTLIAVTLFQDYVRDRLDAEMRREAEGLTLLYAEQALRANEQDRPPPAFPWNRLELASGSRLYYVGLPVVLGNQPGSPHLPTRTGLPQLPANVVRWQRARVVTFEFKPPREKRTFRAVAHQLRLENRGPAFGALIVAKPKGELRERWLTLIRRLGIGFFGGILVAAGLAWYLTRRITGPLLKLSRAADEIAERRYDIDVPEVPPGDEIGHLSDRFRQMAVRLREAEELERNFLMTVSHELRTPLTAIRGHVGALREGLVDDEAMRDESLAVVAAEADRLERLVGDVLDLAKLDTRRFTVHREEVDMGRLLERAYTTFAEEARRRSIAYRQEVRQRPVIVSDGDRVLQIISNLLANAFRWTPDGGSVDLELSAVDGTVAVAVADTGPGIPVDERERIFRPFFSRDGRGGGTGLGLAIARELAIALGGRIELDSEPGKGSRFELVLPAQPASGGR